MPTAPGDPLARLRHQQRRALDAYLRHEVGAHSPHWRGVLERVGLGPAGPLRSLADLQRVPISRLDQLDPAAVVLRPTSQTLARFGGWRYRWAALAARMSSGAAKSVNLRTVEPAYKPVQWQLHDGFPIAYSSEDVERLAESGRRWLELAGLGRNDVIVSLLPADEQLASWELAVGARRAGVALVALGVDALPDDVTALGASVVAGTPSTLDRLAGDLDRASTFLAVGEQMPEGFRQRLEADGAAVVCSWSPPGVRAQWTECRTGHAFHVDGNVEYVEVVDDNGRPAPAGQPGRVVWTGIGWRGTALVRLDTGMQAIHDERPCRACGRFTPRLWRVDDGSPAST